MGWPSQRIIDFLEGRSGSSVWYFGSAVVISGFCLWYTNQERIFPSVRSLETVIRSRSEKHHKSQRKTVLQLIPSLGIGGAEQGCFDLAVYLAQRGYNSLILTSEGYSKERIESIEISSEVMRNLKIIPCENLASKLPWNVIWNNPRYILEVINKNHVDLVHVRSRSLALSLWLAMMVNRTFYTVSTVHGAYDYATGTSWYQNMMLRTNVVVTPSYFMAEYVIDKSCNCEVDVDALAPRLEVIPRGIDTKMFDPRGMTPSRVQTLLASWKIEMNPRKRWKGHDLFLEAIHHLGNTDIVPLLVGANQPNKSYYQKIHRLKQDMEADGFEVHMLPLCSDMPALYKLAHVVVVPSTKPEAHGRVVIESLAMGCPVVTFDHGGARETCLVTKAGHLADVGSIESLSLMIARALTVPFDATYAREMIEKYYSKDAMCRQYESVYRDLFSLSKE